MKKEITKTEYSFRHEFESNEDLKGYGPSGLSLFFLVYYLNIEDIDAFAATAITESNDDKKVDICYLDIETKKLIITQNYTSTKWDRISAPANKASALNTAVAWLFSASIDKVPPGLHDKAIEIRKAICNDEISDIELLFIHNCPESVNCLSELNTVADSLSTQLKDFSSSSGSIKVSYREIGLNSIEEFYSSRKTQILINGWLKVPVGRGYLTETTKDWTAILTTVPAAWIKKLHNEYKNELFSANYRDYLGSIEAEENINNQIVSTATTEPENFWAYNNGITALTYELAFKSRWKKIRGISIINGAQTTGALDSIPDSAASIARVLIRFVQCKDPILIDKIILFNNTQNAIKPEDKRSKDSRQIRIHNDFMKFGIEYYYRRSDQKISRNTITGKSIASPLCAFHGDPQTSYRNPKKIFTDDVVYDKVIRSDISIGHIFLVRALSNAIDKIKNELKRKIASGEATEKEISLYQVLKYSASKHFVIFLIGFVTEEIMGTRITDKYKWTCKDEYISTTNISIMNSWILVLKTILPYISTLLDKRESDAFYEVPRSDKLTKEIASEFQTLLVSMEPTIKKQFTDLRKNTTH